MSIFDHPSKDRFIGKILDGRFEMLEAIGEGAMGTVYKARAAEDNSEVAVKVLSQHLEENQDNRERFEREARALFALDHPNVLGVRDFGIAEGSPYLVTELLDGETLGQFVERQEELPVGTAVDIAKQILAGLSYAHAQGVLHRDLKSENIFIAPRASGGYDARLLDFGLVKFVDDERWGEGRAITAFGEVFGTPAYMSPEQGTGSAVDARSDVYSMGVLLFEMLTGRWPFMEEDQFSMVLAHQKTPAPHLSDVVPGLRPYRTLDSVVQKALAKEPDDRYADATAMLEALNQNDDAPREKGHQHRLLYIGAALAVVVAGVMALLWLQ